MCCTLSAGPHWTQNIKNIKGRKVSIGLRALADVGSCINSEVARATEWGERRDMIYEKKKRTRQALCLNMIRGQPDVLQLLLSSFCLPGRRPRG